MIFVICHQFQRKVNECCLDHVTQHVTIMMTNVGLRQNITWKANIHKSFVTIGRTVLKIELFLFLIQFFFLDPGLKKLELMQRVFEHLNLAQDLESPSNVQATT